MHTVLFRLERGAVFTRDVHLIALQDFVVLNFKGACVSAGFGLGIRCDISTRSKGSTLSDLRRVNASRSRSTRASACASLCSSSAFSAIRRWVSSLTLSLSERLLPKDLRLTLRVDRLTTSCAW